MMAVWPTVVGMETERQGWIQSISEGWTDGLEVVRKREDSNVIPGFEACARGPV